MEHEEDTKDVEYDHTEHEADGHDRITANEDTGDAEEQQPAQGKDDVIHAVVSCPSS